MAKRRAPAPPSTRTRYGRANPEKVYSPLWEMVARRNWSGYQLRQHLGLDADSAIERGSAYRDSIPGPFWSWKRYGRTRTSLQDGRVIRVGGEHEDWYDSDFCIYNDVTVTSPGRGIAFYLYPKAVFPPTDFRTATLVGDEIILIGSLGYRDLRRVGETQVLKLDTRSLRITPVATRGEPPGWISGHKAELEGASIRITGGKVVTPTGGPRPNAAAYVLKLSTMTWSSVGGGYG